MAIPTGGKPIDAKYLYNQLIGFDTQVVSKKYNTKFQFETMPTAVAANEGQIVQYIGATDSNYTNGYFYKCVSSTEESGTVYSWEAVTQQVPEYTLKKLSNPSSTDYAASYELQKDGVKVGDTIDIPKDFFLENAFIGVATAADVAADGKLYGLGFAEGNTYIELDVNIKDKSEPKPLYVNVTGLVDTYTAGNGVTVTQIESGDNEISLNLATGGGLKFTEDKKVSLDFETEAIVFDYSTWNTP